MTPEDTKDGGKNLESLCEESPGDGELATGTVEEVVVNSRANDKRYTRQVWAAVVVSCVCCVVSLLSLNPITVQYLNSRIAKDNYGFKFNDTHSKCDNASTSLEKQIDRVQQDTSLLLVKVNLASGIPACISTFLIGSYSDYIGRKPILLLSTIGGFTRIVVYALVVELDWDLRVFFVAAFLDGILGSYFGLIMSSTAIITDITPDPKKRALNFAIVEGIILPTAAVAQIGIGFLIKDGSFFTPLLVLAGLMLLSLLITLFLLPETMRLKRALVLDPRVHVKKVVGFYFFTGRKKRLLYFMGLGAFMIIALTNLGKQSVETLFELGYPICWDSVQIGIYMAIRMVGTAFVSVIFLKLSRKCLSSEVIGFICALSTVASSCLFGMSTSTAELYIAAIAGALYVGSIPIPRALLSELTSPMEQGALFSSLSFVETVSSLLSGTLFTYIYNTTIHSFKGTVFIIIAGLMMINGLFLLAFRVVRGRSALSDYIGCEQEIDVKKPPDGPSESTTLIKQQ